VAADVRPRYWRFVKPTPNATPKAAPKAVNKKAAKKKKS